MIPALLIEELVNFLKDANKNFRLTEKGYEDKGLLVVPAYIKQRESPQENFYPHIVVRPLKGADDTEGSTADVRLIFGTHSTDVNEGWRELLSLMEHTRQALLKQRILAKKFALCLPTAWEFEEQQPFPEWVGYMELKYSIAQTAPNYFD